MKPAAALLLLCGTLAAQPASVHGTVIDENTGQPLAGVHIALDFNLAIGDRASYGAISDRSGTFSIASLPPGSYIMMVDRPGFLMDMAGDGMLAPVHLAAGEHLELPVKMAARAVIAGRVLDDAGDPVPGMRVDLSKTPDPGQFLDGSQPCDDRGEFRIAVLPGKYYLRAVPLQRAVNDPVEIRTDGSVETNLSITDYGAVNALPGREVSGIEIRLTRQPSLTIAGTVIGPSGPTSAMVWLYTNSGGSHGTGIGADGRFAFHHLRPDTYLLYARGQAPLQSPLLEVPLVNADQPNLQVALAPAGDLSGSVEIVGDPIPGLAVRLLAAGNLMASGPISGGSISRDGNFHLTGIPPGRFRASLDSLPDDSYIDSVLLDGSPVPDGILDFSRGLRSAELKITVRRNAGRISGAVVDQAGHPLSGGLAILFLLSDSGSFADDSFLNAVRPDGKYELKRVRPGKYRISVWDSMTYLGDITGESGRRAAASGEEIEVPPGGRVEKDLRLREGKQ